MSYSHVNEEVKQVKMNYREMVGNYYTGKVIKVNATNCTLGITSWSNADKPELGGYEIYICWYTNRPLVKHEIIGVGNWQIDKLSVERYPDNYNPLTVV